MGVLSPAYPCFDIMQHIPPGSIADSSFLAIPSAMASSVCACVRPVSIRPVSFVMRRKQDRAAAVFTDMGTRTFGFRKSATEVHEPATMDTKPFLPWSAVSKP